ncbi:MAG: methyltransferase domain-containing protein [Candidatus Magasanikbacteria bacterium]|nr:methyltransferase domain-containing protein [Candidatus Magasanikbacteria bacterium]
MVVKFYKFMNNIEKKLNLGCAGYKKEGYINVDWDPAVQPDVIHDLNKFPYPFADNFFGVVEADHVLEHLEKVFPAMNEIHRLLKPGGKLIVKVPHFSRGFTHAGHAHGFDVTFPCVEFKLVRMRLKWAAFLKLLPHLGCGPVVVFLLGGLSYFFSFLANLSPNFCSRFWCFWVGGFEEIEFEFVKK